MKILYALVTVNILYWGFSESYLYEGSFIIGCGKGVIASAVCVLIPWITSLRMNKQ